VFYSKPTVYAYLPNFVSIGYSVALCGQKPPIFAVSGRRHLVMSPVGINLRKLSTDAQLQTFAYPTASKSFLYSNAFMVKAGAHNL